MKKGKRKEIIAMAFSLGTVIMMYIAAEKGINDGRLLIAPLLLVIYLLFTMLGQETEK